MVEIEANEDVDEYRFAARDKAQCGQIYLFWDCPRPIVFLFRRGSVGLDIACSVVDFA